MSWRRLRIVTRALFPRAQADRDLDEEIRFHLTEEARLQGERGMSADAAAAAARRLFGNVALAKEDTRAVWVATALEQFFQDLRFGCRILTRSPGVSATAVILIALVIGGNTTVFSIAHGILAKPSPGVHETGLATVSWVSERGDIETHSSHRVYSHFLEHSTTLRPIAAFDFARVTLTTRDGSYAVRAGIVSPNYFDTLGVRLVKGRPFTAQEGERGTSGLVVVVADHVWRNYLQSPADLAGQILSVNGRPATIVGVAEPGFRGAILGELADVWIPLSGERRGWEWLQAARPGVDIAMIGRLAPNASLAQAQAELTTMWGQLQRVYPDLNTKFKPRLVAYSGTAGGNSLVATRGGRMLAIFSVVTLLTIAIVCANVANLLIARAVVRQREMAVRQSLGASRVRIVRSLLAEGLVLSIVAWIAACLFAWWVSVMAIRFIVPPSEGPVVLPDLAPDWTVVGYALVLALVCTFAVTAGPALRTRRQELLPFLKVGEQGVVPARSKLSRGLVVLQLAFSVLLLTIAGLAHRSLALKESLDVGFNTRDILLATVNTAGSADGPQSNSALLEALRGRLAQLPGVEAVSYTPGSRLTRWINFPVRRDRSAEPVMADDNRVAPAYFATLGVPFIAGEDFPPGEGKAARTAVITRTLAETLWPGEPAVGKTLLAGAGERAVEVKVLGVVRDAFFSRRASDELPRYIFFPISDSPAPPGETTFYIRHRGRQDAIAPAIAKALRDADARVAIARLRSFDSEITSDVAPLWTLTMLLTLFAGGSLLIAAIGQYAVVAFDGRRRTREFGLRIALGASPQRLVRSVVEEHLRLTAVGLGIGFALSVAVAAVLTRVLYGITATDPPTYFGVFVLLAAVSLLACYLPARRAAQTDPMLALRAE
jgi:predicted permease